MPQRMKRIDSMQKSRPHFIRCLKILHNSNSWLFGCAKSQTVVSFQRALTHFRICEHIQQDGYIFNCTARESGMSKKVSKFISLLTLQDALRTEQSIGSLKSYDTANCCR